MQQGAKIYVAGHQGMVGSAILKTLRRKGFTNIVGRTHQELDLTRQAEVERFFEEERPEIVIVAAAKVGGIVANNTLRADFIYENLAIGTNVIHAAFRSKVGKLLFLGSSCIYPRNAPQPMKEEELLQGNLEPTNEPYAIAKIAGIKMCENYYRQHGCNLVSVMPTNLYGPHDNFDPETAHVIPALLWKFHNAKLTGEEKVIVWGTGRPYREFLYVEDLADACLYIMEKLEAKDLYDDGITHINVGTGEDLTISALASMIAEVVGYNGEIEFDTSKPDGAPRKLLDISRLEGLGWRYKTALADGIRETYNWYLRHANTT